MDRYHITLFIHLLTVAAAAATSAIMTIALRRRARARTVGELLDWHTVMASAGKVFPICLASFVITGAYMLNISQTRMFSTGYVVAGLVGVAWLLVSGTFLGIKGKALKGMLDEMAKTGLDQPAPKLVPPPFLAALPALNTGIAIAVAFDMTVKPASTPVALGVLLLGTVVPLIDATRRLAPSAARAPAS